jgi:hypothetical protein
MEGGRSKMIEFNYGGIIIVTATIKMEQYDYRDKRGNYRTTFTKQNIVTANFWTFRIENDLSDLAMLKSILSHFIHACWKRNSKTGDKIQLNKSLSHYHVDNIQELYLVARQKNGIYSLEISLIEEGTPVDKIYLDCQEVLMLDIVIGKAINLLTPVCDIMQGDI